MTCNSTNSKRKNIHGTCLDSNNKGLIKCTCNGLEYSTRYKISFDTIKDTLRNTKVLDDKNIYISKHNQILFIFNLRTKLEILL